MKTVCISDQDEFEAEMFLIMNSAPENEVDDGLVLRCRCSDPDNCRGWIADLWHFGKMIHVPECLLREFKRKCRKFIVWLYKDE